MMVHALKVCLLSEALMDSEGRKCLPLISCAMNKYLHLVRTSSFGLSEAFHNFCAVNAEE